MAGQDTQGLAVPGEVNVMPGLWAVSPGWPWLFLTLTSGYCILMWQRVLKQEEKEVSLAFLVFAGNGKWRCSFPEAS